MVKMCNIESRNNQIYIDCYQEGKIEDHFWLLLDAKDCSVIESSLDSMDIYARQAVAKIRKLSKKGALPKEAMSVWC